MTGERVNKKAIAIGVVIVLLIAANLLIRYPMPTVSIKPEVIAHIGAFPITNSFVATVLASVLCGLFFWRVCRSLRFVPGRVQALVEFILEAFLGLCVSVAGERRGRSLFPLIATIFLFVLFNKWLGLIPGFGTIGITEQTPQGTEFVPILRGGTTDLNMTLALALIAVTVPQVLGIRAIGARAYLGKFINFREGPIGLVVGLLELISEAARLVSYSFRLFGNIFAGEILLVVIAFLVPFGVALPFLGLEVFVGAIQAFIFAILTLMFVTIATETHDGHSGTGQGTGHDDTVRTDQPITSA
jgi:F-type H+-transporting ATPase subunit a